MDNSPLTIGLYGSWGSGKSSMLSALEESINKDKHHEVFKFNAWRHEYSNTVAHDFIEELNRDLASKDRMNDSGDNVILKTLSDIAKHLQGTVSISAPFIPIAMTAELHHDDGQKTQHSLEHDLQQLSEHLLKQKITIVALVDDLDRCSPQQVAQLIEAINTLTGYPGMIFVIAADHDYLVRSIEDHYKNLGSDITGENFLEKIVQIPFWIPTPEFKDDALNDLIGSDAVLDALEHSSYNGVASDLLTIGQGPMRSNPRQVKRLINTYMLLSHMYSDYLHDNDDKETTQRQFLYFLGLQIAWPSLQRRIMFEINNEWYGIKDSARFTTLPVITAICPPEHRNEQEMPEAESEDLESYEQLNEQYSLDLHSTDDQFRMSNYLRSKVFQDITIKQARLLLKRAATGADDNKNDSRNHVDMSMRDSSTWRWEDGQKISKWQVLHQIAQQFIDDKKIETVQAFQKQFDNQIITAVKQKHGEEIEVDPESLVFPWQEHPDDPNRVITIDGKQYGLDWWLGASDHHSIGFRVHRPVIEYFRDEYHYPITKAN